MTSDTLVRHDAKWSRAVLEQIADLLEHCDAGPGFDPFAGVFHLVDEVLGPDYQLWGADIEPKFAAAHPRVSVGDAFDPATYWVEVGGEHVKPLRVITSPTYGNRMAGGYQGPRCKHCQGAPGLDCDDCSGVGFDGTGRRGYAISLGKKPEEESTAWLSWGHKYRQRHSEWLALLRRYVLTPGPDRLILNMADHLATSESGGPQVRQYVCDWWVNEASSQGFRLTEAYQVDTPKSREGSNHEARTRGEMVMVFDLIPHIDSERDKLARAKVAA